MLNPIRHKEALLEWVGVKQLKLDGAYSVHVPDSVTGSGHSRDEIWLSQKLARYFAGLDERALRGTGQEHIERLVVLHYSPDVGWHAHFQMAKPPHMTQADLMQLAEKLWRRSLGPHNECKIKRQLFWAEEVRGGHLPYMLGHLSIDTVDWNNTHFTC